MTAEITLLPRGSAAVCCTSGCSPSKGCSCWVGLQVHPRHRCPAAGEKLPPAGACLLPGSLGLGLASSDKHGIELVAGVVEPQRCLCAQNKFSNSVINAPALILS